MPAIQTATDLLLPMDWACLSYMLDCDRPVDLEAIPSKLFDGEIPEGHPDLVDLGFVEHVGNGVQITDAGRALFTQRKAA